MNRIRSRVSRYAAGGMLAIALATATMLVGCGAKTKMSEEDKANFKGGPMPAGYKDRFAPGNGPPAQSPPPQSTPK